jgi:hypothetical protein
LPWVFIGFGLYTLTEGYHAFRQRTAESERPRSYWWLAGLIGAAGIGMISIGFTLRANSAC